MHSKLHIILFIFFFKFVVLPQNGGTIERISSYKSPTSKSQKKQKKKKERATPKKLIDMAISWNPSILSRGLLGLHYETSLNKKWSLKAGLGGSLWDGIYEDEDINYEFGTLREAGYFFTSYGLNDDYLKRKIGYWTDIYFKYYPKEHYFLEGFFLAPGLRYRQYRSSLLLDKEYNANYSMIDPNVKIGYQKGSFISDQFMIEFYGGIGYSLLIRNGVFITEDTGNEIIEPIKHYKSRLIPLLGLNISHVF